LITLPTPPLNTALIMQAHAQIPTRAAMVIPVPIANLEVSYPVSTFVSLVVSVFVLMMLSFIYLIFPLFCHSLPSLKH
jgi:type IV secretory pathway VirB3-like protein